MKDITSKAVTGSTDIASLFDMMREENLEELEIKDGETYVHIRRKGKQQVHVVPQVAYAPAVAACAPVAAPVVVEQAPESLGDTVTSPIMGVFYRSSSPGAAAFVNEGDVVHAGKTLCIVEAMKVMNEIKAETRMKVVKLLVENGKPITAGQDLFVVEKM